MAAFSSHKIKILLLGIFLAILSFSLFEIVYFRSNSQSNTSQAGKRETNMLAYHTRELKNKIGAYGKAKGKNKTRILAEIRTMAQTRKLLVIKELKTNPQKIAGNQIPDNQITLLPQDFTNLFEKSVRLKGIITNIVTDNHDQSKAIYQTYLESNQPDKKKKVYKLTMPAKQKPLRSSTGVVVEGILLDNDLTATNVTVSQTGRSPQDQGISAPEVSGTRKVLLLPFNFQDDSRAFNTQAEFEYTLFENTPNSFFSNYEFYIESSHNKLFMPGPPTGRVASHYYKIDFDYPRNSSECQLGNMLAWADAVDQLALNQDGINASNYDHILYYHHQNACNQGNGIILGKRVWLRDANYPDVMAHEIGHNLGFGHASSVNCATKAINLDAAGCTKSEYGNYFDNMGVSLSPVNTHHNSGLYKIYQSWIQNPSTQFVEVTQSGNYTLSPIESPVSTPQVLRIKKPQSHRIIDNSANDEYYYLEYRKPAAGSIDNTWPVNTYPGVLVEIGWDFPFSTPFGNRTYLIDTKYATPAREDAPLLNQNDTFFDDLNNITITLTSPMGSAVATLNIQMPGSSPTPTPTPTVTPILPSATPTPTATPTLTLTPTITPTNTTTPTPTITPIPPTVTSTPVPPTPTLTLVPPTATYTPVPPTVNPCPAGNLGNLDCSSNGCIDANDLTVFGRNFGYPLTSITVNQGEYSPDLVIDANSRIDTADYEILRSHHIANTGACYP